jgi:rRNA processing protein Krr1/Pno1
MWVLSKANEHTNLLIILVAGAEVSSFGSYQKCHIAKKIAYLINGGTKGAVIFYFTSLKRKFGIVRSQSCLSVLCAL